MKKDWKIVKIPEVLFYQEGPGVRKHQFTTEGVKLLNVGNINNGQINLSKTKIFISEKEAFFKYKHFLVDDGDLVIASSGIVVDNFYNKIAFIKKEHLPLCMNTSTIRFKVLDKNILDINYFKFFLKTKFFSDQLKKLITGSAQLNFGPSHLKKIDMLLPPLEDQKNIIKILDKADSLRQKRKQAIKFLDAYVNSTFFKMFVDNYEEKNISLVNLEKLTLKITDGVHAKPQYTESGIPFISVKNITTTKLKFDDCKYISLVDYKNFTKRCNAEFNDVLYTKVGATYGRACIVDIKKEFSLYVSVALIKPRKDLVDPMFLKAVLNSSYVKRQADKSVKGAGVPDLHLVEIKKFKIPLPSMEEQKIFSKLVLKIEFLKQKMLVQSEKMEKQFQMLMQRSFSSIN